MPRVHKRKAAKDYPDHGIVKGDTYYYTKMKTGPRSSRVLRSKTPFRRSQLTGSEYLGTLYDIEDDQAKLDSLEDSSDIAERYRTLGEETLEKFDNMPEGLQAGDTGQMLQERADACETAADEIEDLVGQAPEEPEEDASDEDREEYTQEIESLIEQIKEVSADA